MDQHQLIEYSSLMLTSNNLKKPAGRKKFRETRHPIYRGISMRNSGKWVARAHDVAAIALRGRTACLNFADSIWRLPIPASSDTKDIQRAAAEVAHAFRPLVESEGVLGEFASSTTPEMRENAFFMDEEELFYMAGLLTNMAEGLMLPPPECSEIGDHYVEADDSCMSDMSLWSYSL
ncbi:dehydration-responsive element-binding protein 1A-like [Solanum dulcamara]|uniref:dehydration-responsive element-binding protein 1A-like n=1 Tax=Solanum dulcamara TaxID=45834 RepID=UPI002485E5C3|nr:dehydration-responsive element-binding protein 1A-like [Solanum dulcamara]